MTLNRPFLLASCLALKACDDARAGDPVDVTLCSEERDHIEIFCGPGTERIDSTRAFALLREEYPGAKIYTMDGGGGGGTLNVDGEDDSWSFWLTDENETWISASVRANGDVEGEEIDDANCDGAPFEPLDSRRATHEAIAAFDAKVRFFEHGNLFLRQNVCGHEPLPEAHYVLIYPRADDASESGSYYARFRHDSSFIDLVGPCLWPLSFDECLAGVVVEPEE
jgi:hypothetical protein